MDRLTEPFRHAFMQHALLTAVLVGVTCAVLGLHVAQRRAVFVGDALVYTTLPGLVVAHLSGWSLSLGGLGAALAPACSVAGLAASYVLEASSGASIVPACTAGFLAVSLGTSWSRGGKVA
jgi:ABC-type Mn2+/Zn2+ transport system permease subunit